MISNQTKIDLKLDYEELLYLISSIKEVVVVFTSELENLKRDLPAPVTDRVREDVDYITLKSQFLLSKAEQYLLKIQNDDVLEDTILNLIQEKKNLKQQCRILYKLSSAAVNSLDWQSPSFGHSLYSQSGRHSGKIVAHESEYMRDVHFNGIDFQNNFLNEYIEINKNIVNEVNFFATNSGMGSFTTIMYFLLSREQIDGKILIGDTIYFENKLVLEKIFKDKTITVNSLDTQKIKEILTSEKISAIFLDALHNVTKMGSPNLAEILTFITENCTEKMYFIVDDTCIGLSYKPFKNDLSINKNITVISHGSLNKFYQFGMDLVTGGYIIAFGEDTEKLLDYRTYSGTNILSSSSVTIPKPNKKFLLRRLKRIERNSLDLSNFLQDEVVSNFSIVKRIVYCGLNNHPSYEYFSKYEFKGGFINIIFADEYQNKKFYDKFLSTILSNAQSKNIDLILGTSFGLDTTRVYVTGSWDGYGEIFVRIALGTETEDEINYLKDLFIQTLRDLE